MTLRYDKTGGLLQTIRGDGGSSVDLDPAGNLYLAGFSEQGSPSVAKYDVSGARAWTAPLETPGEFLAKLLVAADSTGAVTVAATARGASSPTAASGRSGSPPTAVSGGGACSTAVTIPASTTRSPRSRSTAMTRRWSPARPGTATARCAGRPRTSSR